MSNKPNGIAILIPSSGRDVCLEWALAIKALVPPVGVNQFMFVSKANPDEPDASKRFTRAQQRESLAEKAVMVNSEFMMWLDDDTLPPSTAMQELFFVLAQNPKAAICGGIYCTKTNPPEPLVFLELGGGVHWRWTLGDVFKCAGLGTGCMMVRTSVMQDIPKPWFQDTSDSKLGDMERIGELDMKITGRTGTDDVYFCKKVSEAGYDILAHGGVLPAHYGAGKFYKIPTNSYPVVSYQEKLDAVNAGLPEGQKKIIL